MTVVVMAVVVGVVVVSDRGVQQEKIVTMSSEHNMVRSVAQINLPTSQTVNKTNQLRH